MVKESKENTSSLNFSDYERIRDELVGILSRPGGGPGVFTDVQKILIEGLDQARKEAIKSDGQAIVCKKLMEMDSLIIETAVHNLKSAQKHMCGVHFPLVSYARNLVAEQKKEFDRLTNKGGKIKEPFDLSFLVGIESRNIRNRTAEMKLAEEVKTEVLPAAQARMARGDYKTVKALRAQGLSIREIAKKTGWSNARVGRIAKEI